MSKDPRGHDALADGQDPEADRWLDALAGRIEPDDANTRQAASVRAYFAAELEAENRRREADPANTQRLKVLLNAMQAEGDAAARRAQAATPVNTAPGREARQEQGGGVVSRLWRWLFPPAPGAATWRVGSVAAGLLGLTVALRVLMPGADDDAGQMKSAPPAAIPAAGTSAPGSVAPLVVTGAEPLQDALALQAALSRAGVQAEVFPLGASARLEAPVPAAQAAAVQAELSRLGLTWAPADTIVVEFKAP